MRHMFVSSGPIPRSTGMVADIFVVSAEVAHALFPEEDPVGKSVKVGTD